MRSWLTVLALLLVACAAAWGWHALALDPGQVLLRFAGWRVETTLLVAVLGLLLLWVAASLLWRLMMWPRAAWRRRSRRRGRERIADGLVALIEGRMTHAARELDRAAHIAELRAPALLGRARAAQALGDADAVQAALENAAAVAPSAALSLRTRFLLDEGRAAEALALLKAEARGGNLAPAACQALIDAALQCGDAATALSALASLGRLQALPAADYERLYTRTQAAALAQAANLDELNGFWAGFSRAQRRLDAVIIAYARRTAALGHPLAGIGELEAALRRDWSEAIVRAYGQLGPGELSGQLRQAEMWLAAQPNSAGLLLTLGRLCNQSELWGKAREYLTRALAIAEDAEQWEAFGDACAGQGDADTAQRAYRNALRQARGAATEPVADLTRGLLDTRASVVEERSEHGVPRLILPR